MAVIVEQKEMKRPFVVIGTMAAVIGGVMAATALLETLVLLLCPLFPQDSFPGFFVFETLFYVVPSVLRFAFGLLALLAGFYLVRGRSSGRALLEAPGWVGGLFCILYAVVGLKMALTHELSRGRGLFLSQATSYLVYAVVLGTMIYYLRKPSMRAALREQDERAEATEGEHQGLE